MSGKVVKLHPPKAKPPFTGQRRAVAVVPPRPLLWPSTSKERFDLFEAWHYVAMRYAHKSRIGLHFLCVARNIIIWKDGCIKASNNFIADQAGGCSIDVIKRELDQLSRLGLITRSGTARSRPGGGVARSREIRLAFPALLEPWLRLPENVQYDE